MKSSRRSSRHSAGKQHNVLLSGTGYLVYLWLLLSDGGLQLYCFSVGDKMPHICDFSEETFAGDEDGDTPRAAG